MSAVLTDLRPGPAQVREAHATRAALLEAVAIITRCGARNRGVASALSALGDHEQGEALKTVVGFVARAVQGPATTTAPAWAAELAPQTVLDWVDLLGDEGGVVARLPLARFDLDGGIVKVPYRTTRTLAAAFRAEAAPIRVAGATLALQALEGRSMGVIATCSAEAILAASDAVLQRLIRTGMVSDTAGALDTAFFDAVPRDAIRPAGIQNGIDPADTAASSGATLEDIVSDMRGRLTQLHARGLGGIASRVSWVMHADLAASLLTLSDELRLRATFLGLPVISSLTVPPDVVFLLDGNAIGFAADVPTFESSTEATLHEDDGAPNADEKTGATVLPLATGSSGAGAITAAPVRSLFQTNVTALKGVWQTDWAVLRPGAVQTITGVAW
ncbi:hypothetical protein QTH87_13470 [Variovorax sp. J22P168]|uniref:hypothetical protein n=1 Tax=Variovorax jilinensis TaxID=3053513 RepID=UPI002576549F|nr:hypothetical protein [Variovorax sp. J22P168]MDM0013446.1 hypothetical protein [Variovorax sp. J22P168]